MTFVTLERPSDIAGYGQQFEGRLSLQQVVVRFLLIEAALFLACAIAPAWYLPVFTLQSISDEQFESQIEAAVFGLLLYLLLAHLCRVYSPARILGGKYISRLQILALLGAFSAMFAVAAATKTTHVYSRLWFFSWLCSAAPLILVARTHGLFLVRRRLERGACIFRALSLGIGSSPLTGDQLLDYTDNQARAIRRLSLTDVDEIASVAEVIRADDIDQIYISAPWSTMPELTRAIATLRFLPADIFLCCDDMRLRGKFSAVARLGDGVAFQASVRPIAGWDQWLKRCEDIILSLFGLVVLSPIFLLTAIAIKLDSRGPVLFPQMREGFNGRFFRVLKFRSMYADQADPHAALQTSRNDRRVTRVGRFIRRFSIDELPQLLNVLQGSMSLVGPRPHAALTSAEGKALADVVEYYASRHRVKSGITGWAQINGLRGELDSVQKVKSRVDYDIHYIENWSLWFDLKILVLTVADVIQARRAY